jgi:hypothetical protein
MSAEKVLQVSRFVGPVEVISGAPSASYTLVLHTDDPLESDAAQQFADYHLGLGHHAGETLVQTVGQIDLALRARLTLRIPAGTEVVHVDTLAGKILIHGSVDHLDLHTHGGDIELDESRLLNAETMGGSIQVNHSVGDSFLRSGGGEIHVDTSVGDLEITSQGGNIWLKTVARAHVESAGGNIDVVHCIGMLQAHTAGGNITLGAMDGDVSVETGGGNIRIGMAHGPVVARTAQGNIELWKLYQGADAHTGLGRITAEFVGDRNSMKSSKLVTSMGDIVVFFAENAQGTLHAVAGNCPSRHIISEFPELKISAGSAEYGPRSIVAEGTVHGGGPLINMQTMVGQIELRNAR